MEQECGCRGEYLESESEVAQSCPTLCDPMEPARLLCPWDSPGKNTGMGCHFLLQGIFPNQGSNPGLLLWQISSLPLCHLGSPVIFLNRYLLNECMPGNGLSAAVG